MANILDEKTDTYNWTCLYILYFCWINTYQLQVYATLYIFGLENKYFWLDRLQVHAAPYILGEKTSNCD